MVAHRRLLCVTECTCRRTVRLRSCCVAELGIACGPSARWRLFGCGGRNTTAYSVNTLGYRPGTFIYRYLPADTGARFVAGERRIDSICVLASTGNVCFNPFDTAELVVFEAQLVASAFRRGGVIPAWKRMRTQSQRSSIRARGSPPHQRDMSSLSDRRWYEGDGNRKTLGTEEEVAGIGCAGCRNRWCDQGRGRWLGRGP